MWYFWTKIKEFWEKNGIFWREMMILNKNSWFWTKNWNFWTKIRECWAKNSDFWTEKLILSKEKWWFWTIKIEILNENLRFLNETWKYRYFGTKNEIFEGKIVILNENLEFLNGNSVSRGWKFLPPRGRGPISIWKTPVLVGQHLYPTGPTVALGPRYGQPCAKLKANAYAL